MRTGAVAGLLVGALRGRALEGATIGAAMGGASGYYDGWREENEDARARELAAALRESSRPAAPTDDPDEAGRRQLERFLGMWDLEGWALDDDGSRLDVTGGLRGRVEMGSFVEVDFVDLRIEGFDGQLWGTSTLGFEASSGYTLTSRFNTLPEPGRFTGSWDAGNTMFSFREVLWQGGTSMSEGQARVYIRFNGPDRFIMETRLDGLEVERYTATRN